METIPLTPASMQRRVFVKGVGYVTLAFLLSTSLGGCESCNEQIKNRPIRRRLRTGSAEVDADVETYRQAVAAMKALPASNPRSWAAQAAIHGTVAGGFNLCQHGTDHFFSWHRAYLLYFERICQELTGNKKWGLPYWNWNKNPDLLPQYVDPTNDLFSTRTRTSATGLSAVTNSALDPIFPDGNFFTFSSQIEGTPHNSVHGYIGGIMGTGGSAGDPLFWNHHCMVDYCWYKWNVDMGNDNPGDAGWTGTSWNHFVDASGNPATVTAGITTLFPLLSYQYECSSIGSGNFQCLQIVTKRDFQILEARLKKGRDIKFDIRRRIPIAERAGLITGRPFHAPLRLEKGVEEAIIGNDMNKEFVFASIDFARLPKNSDFFVRVFINNPNANPETSIEDPHYAGSFAFFGTDTGDTGMHEGHGPHQPKFLVNLSPTIKALRERNELQPGSGFSVQLVPVPYMDSKVNPEDTLALDHLSLIITPVVVAIPSE